jgi:hypothetical protein
LFGKGAAEDGVGAWQTPILLGVLVHDMGEILGELSSLAQRSVNKSLREQPEVERDIFRIALSEAYRATANDAQGRESFYLFLHDMRSAAGIGHPSAESSALGDAIARFAGLNKERPLPEAIVRRVEKYLALYDMAELKSEVPGANGKFIGNAVKVIEHLQGCRHYWRFAPRAPGDVRPRIFSPGSLPSVTVGHWVQRDSHDPIPVRFLSNYRMMRNMQYCETELSHLCAAAKTVDERALARELCKGVYMSQAEALCISRPVLDREVRTEHPLLIQLHKEFARTESAAGREHIIGQIRTHLSTTVRDDLRRYREMRRNLTQPLATDRLYPLESRGRLASLYLKAVDSGYAPTNELPLGMLEKLPEELHGFSPRTVVEWVAKSEVLRKSEVELAET